MSEKPHRRLKLWQKAIEFVVEIYGATRLFPAHERYGIASQMQRAAVSIPSNIAEGAAKKSTKDYLNYLYTARGSLSELDTQIEIADRLGYLKPDAAKALQDRLEEVGKMLSGLIRYVAK